jgi:PAS domain S-box-containing protein
MASLWIFLSDYVVELIVPDEYLTTAQSIKGFGFIIATAFGLYFIVLHYYKLIRQNEQEYRKLFKDNPHPMWVYDMETLKFLTVNNAAVAKYHYTVEEFRSMNIMQIRPQEDQDAILMFVKRVEGKGYHDSGIWRHRDKNGKIFFSKVSSHSTTFGNVNARVVLAIDVDEQVQAQRKIQLSETKLKGLINNSDDLIWMVDTSGVIVTANGAFQQMFKETFGFEPDLSNKMEFDESSGTFLGNWSKYIRQAFQGTNLRVEEEVTLNGKMRCYDVIVNAIHNEHNEIIGVGCFARDISDRKEAENQIRDQVKKLQEVAWIQSHQLRKPLANIMGLLNLLKSENKSIDQQQELFKLMHISCNELDTVVKSIVDKTSTGKSSSET